MQGMLVSYRERVRIYTPRTVPELHASMIAYNRHVVNKRHLRYEVWREGTDGEVTPSWDAIDKTSS